MKKVLALVSLLMISIVAYAATMTSLTKQQVMDMLSDHTLSTVSLITLDNKLVNNNSAMIYFDKQGKVVGQLSMKPDTGPQNDNGTYMVKTNGALCLTWQSWNMHNPVCVFVYKVANGFIFINEANNKLETMVLTDKVQSGNQITTMSTTTTTQETTTETSTMNGTDTTNGGATTNGTTDTTNGTNNGSMNGMQTNGSSGY